MTIINVGFRTGNMADIKIDKPFNKITLDDIAKVVGRKKTDIIGFAKCKKVKK